MYKITIFLTFLRLKFLQFLQFLQFSQIFTIFTNFTIFKMTTTLFGVNEFLSRLEFTKARIIPNKLYLLSNPINNKYIKIEATCDNGNIFDLMNIMNVDASTFTSNPTKKFEKNIVKLDSGYVIPLNVDQNIKGLAKKKDIKKCFKIDKSSKNYFIYQWVDNKLYVLVSVVKNYFQTPNSKKIYSEIETHLQHISKEFKDTLKDVNDNKKNKRNTYSIYGGCSTMRGHPNYPYPATSERHCHVAQYISDYMSKYNYTFEEINLGTIHADFEKSKKANEKIEIKFDHFEFVLKDENRYNFYLYLKENLFSLTAELSSVVSSLIQNQFPELYENFNEVNLPSIKTRLTFFKSFVINFNVGEDDNGSARQGAVDVHKDKNDVLNAFCVIVVFGKFTGGDLILREIGITLEIESGYIVLLRSALLEHFNSLVIGPRWSIVFYLRKDIFNEK